MKFSEFKLDPSLQSAIDKLGYVESTPIQEATIPTLLEGKDISGLAQTGTGKTAAFLLPMMERILRGRGPLPEDLSEEDKAEFQKRAFPDWRSQNFILILVPTRELAEQVYENIVKLSEFSGLRGVSVYGGTSYDKQKEAFKTGVEFVVATPGRLIDLYKEHFVDLKQVRAIIFDEADRMFDMGFKDDMKFVLQRVPSDRQFLVFSATLNFDVLNTAYQFGADPVEINISRDQPKAENVKDAIFHVGQEDKGMYLLSLLKRQNSKQVIVFSNFKMNVEKISAFLSSNGYPAMAISSLLSQSQRNRVIELFKSDNEQNILVATDVAARGLDIKGVDMVVNYELPQDAESYVHRIGRTGRAGSEGFAFSFVSDRDVESLGRIEDYLKHTVEMGWMEDADLVRDFKPFPSERYGSRSSNAGHSSDGRPQRGDRPDRRPRSGERGPDRGPDRGQDRGGSRGDHRPRVEGRPDRQQGARPPRTQDQQANGSAGSGDQQQQRSDGRRPEGARRQEGRSENRRPLEGRSAQGRNSNSPRPRSDQAHSPNSKPAHARGSAQHSGAKRTASGAKVHPKVAEKSLTKKVTGFFKKLFGG